MDVGYVRVSSVDQHTDRQLDGIKVEKMFVDKCSGKTIERAALTECLNFVREGDVLHVHSIDRLARNLQNLLELIELLNKKGVIVNFHKEGMVFNGENNPMQKLHLQIMGSVAEFERALIRERQLEGIAIAKQKGKYKGRKSSLSESQKIEARRMLQTGQSKASVAKTFRVSRATIYRVLEK